MGFFLSCRVRKLDWTIVAESHIRVRQDVLAKLLFVVSLAATTGCSPLRPVLYPNAHLQQVGEAQAQRDVEYCCQQGEQFVKSGGEGERMARDAAVQGAKGGAFGGAGSGLGPGHFARRDLFVFKADDLRRHEFDFERVDSGQAVHVTYDPSRVPPPAGLHSSLAPALKEPAPADDVVRFRTLWLGYVRDILSSDGRAVHLVKL